MERVPRVVVVHPDEAMARQYVDWVPGPYDGEWVTPAGGTCEVPEDVDVFVASNDLPPDCRTAILDAVEGPDGSTRAELVVLYGVDDSIEATPPVTATMRAPTTVENFQTVVRRRALLQQYRNQFDPLRADAPPQFDGTEAAVPEEADDILEELLEFMSLREIMLELFR